MANVNINISYNPVTSTWSLSTDGAGSSSNGNVVHLKESGNTSIQWSIAWTAGVAADDDIDFNTDPNSPGIQFTGTPAWPGSAPNGNANNWNATVNNTQNGQQYYFKVNAVISGDGPNQYLSWDPDVQEDPPNVVI
jgi:hypothetical protein